MTTEYETWKDQSDILWAADRDNMCQGGVQDAYDDLLSRLQRLIRDFLCYDLGGDGDCDVIIASDLEAKINDEFGTEIANEIGNMLSKNLARVFDQTIVEPFNERCNEIRDADDLLTDSARESIEESIRIEVTRDYYSFEDYNAETERADAAEMRLENERENSERLEDELEKMSELVSTVSPHGSVAALVWNPGRQCFVCPVTGRNFVLTEKECLATSAVA